MGENEKETIISKLINELIDEKDRVTGLTVRTDQLDMLSVMIFNNLRLNYDGDALKIADDELILGYLKAIYPARYSAVLGKLKEERENELRKAQAKEKGKKEA